LGASHPAAIGINKLAVEVGVAAQLTRIEHEQNEKDEDVPDDDDLLRESAASIVERARQFMTIKELLTATALGTS
jgi:hypothetical protein